MWDLILETGKEYGLVPAGLGARDTLRFEAALPLYGQEIDKDITPLEAGLGFFVKLNKEDFIGKEALANQKAEGLKRKVIGFEMVDRGIPRSHYEVFAEGKKIGYVTTGSFSPTLKKNIGLALIEAEYAKEGTEIEISVRNKNLKAKVIKKPFYTKKYKKN
jgi:aminomethyltransferase